MKKHIAIILIVLTTLLGSSAQILYKIGSKNIGGNIESIIYNAPIIIGLMLYGVGFIFVIRSLKEEEVTKLYPIMTLSYIWVTLGSFYFFNEPLNFFKILGVLTIISGIILINYKSQNDKTIKIVGV